MEFWAVVGAANWRKSSTIRSLTGAFGTKPIWEVQVGGVPTKVYVETSAPQEGAIKTPSQIVALAAASAATHLMIALRHTGTSAATYDADQYIAAFLSAGWTMKGILIVSPEPTAGLLAAKYSTYIDYAPTISWPPSPSNAIANVVRSKWGL